MEMKRFLTVRFTGPGTSARNSGVGNGNGNGNGNVSTVPVSRDGSVALPGEEAEAEAARVARIVDVQGEMERNLDSGYRVGVWN
jgi:hypothetical protein